MKLSKKVFVIVAIVLLIISGIRVFREDIESSGNYSPVLNDPHGIVIDEEGKIFCGVIHDKIYVYDKYGNFVRLISFDAEGGDFQMKLEDSKLKVATIRNDIIYTFDTNGKLIGQEEFRQDWGSFGQENNKMFVDSNNNIYKVRNFLLIYPYIQKITPNGVKKTIVSVPFRQWIFSWPLPGWIFAMVGLILLGYSLGILHIENRYFDDDED